MERDTSAELPLNWQAALLCISRASLYYRPRPIREQEVALKHRLDVLYTAYPFLLSVPGFAQNRADTGRRGLLGGAAYDPPIPPGNGDGDVVSPPEAVGPWQRSRASGVPVPAAGPFDCAPQSGLGRGYHLHSAGQRLDVSGGVPGLAQLDWHSRYVVAWELSDTLEMDFVLACRSTALEVALPQIVNSDQGSHFTSERFTGPLLSAGVQISMDGRGRCMDNIFTERLWRSVKYEEVYLHDYTTPRQARQGLTRYLEFYNHERPHQALNYQTPAELYGGMHPAIQFAHRLTLKGAEPTLNKATLLS